MATATRAVIYDLGGVLFDWNPRHLFRKLFASDAAGMEKFLREVCNHDWNAQMDAGKPPAQAAAELMTTWPEHAVLIAAYRDRWSEMLGEADADSVALLEGLSGIIPIYALTNFSAQNFPVARQRFAFLRLFREILVSGEVGLAKPDPRIFELALQRFGLDARGVVYIDDRAENVAAAAGLGMTGLVYTGAGRLSTDLAALGIKVTGFQKSAP